MLRRSLIFLVLLSAGCVSLEPHYSTPESPIPATLPGAQGQGKAISHDWQQVIHDPRLQQVVTIALNSNRDVQKRLLILTQHGRSMGKLMRRYSRR